MVFISSDDEHENDGQNTATLVQTIDAQVGSNEGIDVAPFEATVSIQVPRLRMDTLRRPHHRLQTSEETEEIRRNIDLTICRPVSSGHFWTSF